MELRQLRSFVAVAEELHFRRAAERLHLAQPSVSQQIRTLEAELGVQLFERNRRGAALTPAGEALLAEARELLARADQAAALARPTGCGQRGRLRLSLTRSLTGGIAGAIVAAYRSALPRGRARPERRQHDAPRRAAAGGRHRRGLRPPSARGARPRGARPRTGADGLRAPRGSPSGTADDGRPARTSTTSRSSGGPKATAPAPGARSAERSAASRRGPRSTARSPRRSGSSRRSQRARGSPSSCSSGRAACRIPGAVYRRFASPEPTMGIALAWRRGDTLPTLKRLREVATRAAQAAA